MKDMVLDRTNPLSTQERDAWLRRVAQSIDRDMVRKATAGRIEHGCDLGTMDADKLFTELHNELIDAHVYLSELSRRCHEQPLAKASDSDIVISRELLSKLYRVARNSAGTEILNQADANMMLQIATMLGEAL